MSGQTKIPDHLNPSHINYLLAKSKEFSEDKQNGDTLAQHTWDVLSRLADMKRLHPHLGADHFWERLFWGCFLHDFGKAASGFQERLRDNKTANKWSEEYHRHEILSLAFVDGLFPQGHPDRFPIICVIATHHKDLYHKDDQRSIFRKYGRRNRGKDELNRIKFLMSQLSDTVIADLWDWVEQYAIRWQDHLSLGDSSATQIKINRVCSAESIVSALDEMSDWVNNFDPIEDNIEPISEEEKRLAMLYRGTILASDHSASAGVGMFPDMRLTDDIAKKPFEALAKKLERPIDTLLHSHQTDMQNARLGHAIMIAPTGSGKTEAAILWTTAQIRHKPASRIFYTLPYQASMNAMANRLSLKYFGMDFGADTNDQVTIQHSRSTLKFYQDAMNRDDMHMDTDPKKSAQAQKDARSASDMAKKRQNLAQLNYFPIQVFSPYQMLKAAYGLKGYEALLLDYTDALFIFDEIHAYDPKRLALIISYIGYLAKYFRARFLIMTATLPPLIEDALRAVLPAVAKIRADQTVFDQSKRHTVHFIDGDISAQTERMIRLYKEGKSVLVVCNQVKTAQLMYDQFRNHPEFLPLKYENNTITGNIMLLHGRFNGADRRDKEELLMRCCGVDTPPEDRRPVIVIATQVVEVSLNVDFDTLFTEPAPLEALLQRFGRVNRGRPTAQLCPVYIMTAPYGDSYKPYDEPMVMQSVAVLRDNYDGQPIDESQVDAMLAQIYTGVIAEQWQADYTDTKKRFEDDALHKLKPFESAEAEIVKLFYKLFDGTQVLPVDLEADYYHAIEYDPKADPPKYPDYFKANALLVNITHGQFHQLRGHGLITEIPEGEFFAHARVPYSAEYGLQIQKAINAQKDEQFEDEDV